MQPDFGNLHLGIILAPAVNMNKLLVVCGPTATGKTDLALKLAKLLDGVLVSADSRQVYKHMDIGTGKDLERVGRIYGYDIALPRQEYSVAQYLEYTKKIVKKIWSSNKLPILVGGTGLYIKAVVDGIETANIPRNKLLRQSLEAKGVSELYDILASDDPVRAANMNSSDRKNPRRLIRAIEIAIGTMDSKKVRSIKGLAADTLFIGLTAPKDFLNKRIFLRVEKRIDQGIEREIEFLLKHGVTWDMQSMNSLGYKQFKEHFEEGKSIDEVISEWIREEGKYAKRQMTWFKKDKRVKWFDVSDSKYLKKVEALTQNWYTTPNAKKN